MAVTGDSSVSRRSGALSPVELAQASVMAALCAATAIISVVVPFAAGLSLLGTVPMGLLAYRYRLRVLITATVAGAIIAFLIAGMGGFMTVVNCAYIGGLTGIVKRRGRGTPTVFFSSLVAGALFGRGRRGGAGGPGAAAPPDLRVGDRQHQRHRRDHRAHPEHAGRWPTNSSATSPPRWTTGRTCSSRPRCCPSRWSPSSAGGRCRG